MSRPNTFLIAALSLDGYIAQHAQQTSTKWTSKEDAQFFQTKTKEAGVMIMGRATYETIGRPLPGRLTIVMTRTLKDSQERLSVNAIDLPEIKVGTGKVVFTDLQPEEALATLKKAGIDQVAICGGATVYDAFLQANLVDKLYITIEPILFGVGVRLANHAFTPAKQLKLVQTHQLSLQTVVLEYQPI